MLPPEHPCARLHGHNYVVRVVLEGALDMTGFVRDYGELVEFKRFIDEQVDHRYLGYGTLLDEHMTVPGLHDRIEPVFALNPTAENMAKAFFEKANDMFPEVAAVGVSETPKTWAWYMLETEQ